MVTQSEVQHIIQERMKELQELKHNVDVLKVRLDFSDQFLNRPITMSKLLCK